jgi:hypothetical protein
MDCQRTSEKNALWPSKTRETILSPIINKVTVSRVTTLVTKVQTMDNLQIKTKAKRKKKEKF